MVRKLRNIAIIPARGGSKRLTKKNTKLLNGKPLVEYAIIAAVKSNCFDRILVSSDDDIEVPKIAEKYVDNNVIFEKRPERLASDTSKVIELICELAEREDIRENYDTITLMLPTAPFRKGQDIINAFGLLTTDIDSVTSVTSFEMMPTMSMRLDSETKIMSPVFEPCPLITGNTRSQDHEPMFRPNGCFYISWIDKLRINKNYFKGEVKGYVMERGVDIDDQKDFEYADFLIKNNYANID